MKKILLVFLAITSAAVVSAQSKKTDWSKIDLSNRPGDHFVVQLSSDHWTGAPDSIKSHITGLGRGLNIYVMLDKPFKGNPRFSAAFGVGVGSSSIYFKKMNVDVKSSSTKLPFTNLDSSSHFKKYKLATSFLEVPIEIRFTADPLKDSKSFKAAIGVKVGTLLNAHTKGKTLQSASGTTIGAYTEKENKKTYFNTTRLSVTGRVGYGKFSLFGSYQINSLFKDGVAPAIKPFQIGFCISGL